MTDIEKLKALLHEFGVPYEETCGDAIYVSVKEGAAATVSGYFMFCTIFEFDLGGKFLRMGAWE